MENSKNIRLEVVNPILEKMVEDFATAKEELCQRKQNYGGPCPDDEEIASDEKVEAFLKKMDDKIFEQIQEHYEEYKWENGIGDVHYDLPEIEVDEEEEGEFERFAEKDYQEIVAEGVSLDYERWSEEYHNYIGEFSTGDLAPVRRDYTYWTKIPLTRDEKELISFHFFENYKKYFSYYY